MRLLTTITLASLLLAGCSSEQQSIEPSTQYTPVEYNNSSQHAMILCIGQSNMANSGIGLTYTAHSTNRIDNSYEEVVAQSPVGSSGIAGSGGSFMPLLGDMLVEAGKHESVTYINVAVAGTLIQEWTPDAESHFGRIEDASGYEFTHILFHQGESDASTPVADYKARFLRMLQGIRDLGIDAPLYLAQTSYLNGKTDASVIQAHLELIDGYSDIKRGAYTDVLGEEYRYDSSHFNRAGLIAHAELWEKVL